MKIKIQLLGAVLCLALAGSLYAQAGVGGVGGDGGTGSIEGTAAPTLQILPPFQLPVTTVGASYSQTLAAAYGVGTLTWSESGTLPAGLSLNSSTGTISGTVGNNAGNYQFTVTVTDSSSPSPQIATQVFTLAVQCTQFLLTGPATWPTASQSIAYNYTVPVSGGIAPLTFSALNLPASEIINSSTGVVTGTPGSAGIFSNIQITVTDSCPTKTQTVSGTFTEQVLSTLSITNPPNLSPATTGVPFSTQLTAAGGTPPYTNWAVISGSLPAGIGLNPSTGVISGTATGAGLSSFTIQVTDSAAGTATLAMTLNVACPGISFATQTLPNGTQGQFFSFQEQVTGGFGTINFAGSGFPQGMGIALGGLVSGTPTGFGTFTPTIVATDSCPTPQTTSITPTLNIAQQVQPNPPQINTTSPLPQATQNQAYNLQLQGSQGTTPYNWAAIAGAFPSGMSLSTTGVISGSPTVAGSFSITIQITDAKGLQSIPVVFALTVVANSGPLTITNTSPLPGCTINQTCSIQFVATGGTSPYSWSVPGGGGGGGAAWTLVNTPAAATTIDGFDIRQSNNEWYIADRSSGHYYKSTNQGSSWTDITSNIPTGTGIFGWGIQVNPHNGSLLAIGQGNAANTMKFWVSTNDGGSWTQLIVSGFQTAPFGAIVTGCAMPIASGGNLVCGGYGSSANHNAFYSTDDGVTGTVVTNYTTLPGGTVPGGTTGLGRNPVDGSYFMGTEAAGFWKSTDAGVHWTQLLICPAPCSGTEGNAYGLTFDASGDPLFSAQGGIYKGTGSGFSYTFTKIFGVGTQGRGILVDSNGAIYWGHNGSTGSHSSYRSIDNGASFQPFDTGLPSGLDSNHYTQNTNDNNLYAVFFADPTNAANIYRTPLGASPLPPGMSLNSSGLLSGTPTTAGTYTFTVKVTDNVGATAFGTFSLTVSTTAPPQPQITTTSPLPDEIVGQTVNFNMAARGGVTPYAWSQPSGSFPAGVSMNGAGAITGTPTTAGTSTANIQVTDNNGTVAGPQAFSITVTCPAETISTTSLPPAVTGTQYNFTVQGTGGILPFTWGFTGLPTGLTGNSSTGVISGTTSVSGTASVTITRTDSCLPSGTVVSVTLPLQVNKQPLAITTTSIPSFTLNQAGSAPLSASGGTPPYTWTITAGGPLQTGLALTGATGIISGTPTASGTVSPTFQVTDNAANTATATLPVTVASATGADNRNCGPNGVWTGPASKPVPGGNASAPQVCVRTAVSDTPSPGSTVTVTAGSCSSLQSAISSAVAGENIILLHANGSAQDTFAACTIKPAAAGNPSNWITVTTDSPNNLPPEGSRISPAWVGIPSLPGRKGYGQPTTAGNYLPKIIGSAPSTIQFAGTAAYWRFIGIEITSPAGTNYTQLVQLAGNHIIFDRVLAHGGNSPTGQDRDSVQGGFTFGTCTYCAVVDSYIYDIHCISGGTCQQAAGIALGGNSTAPSGPSKVVNTYIESSGENVLSGGGGCSGCTILPASDIEFRRNHTYKPPFWATADPSYFGSLFELDNCFEMKNVQRLWVEGNIFENSWAQGSQQGNCFILGPKNQASGVSGTATSNGTGTITWVSGTKFSSQQVAPLCGTPNHCNFRYNGITYQVQTFVSATQITVSPAPPASTTALAFTAFLPGLNAFAVNNDVIVINNYITGAARVGGIYLVNSDGGDVPGGLNRVFLQNNGADHIDGWYYNNNSSGACCVWATGEQLQSSSVFINGLVLDHNTFVTYLTGGSKGIGPSFGFGSTKQTINNLQVTNNIGTSGFGSSGFSGSVETLVTGWTPKSQLCWDHNLFAETTNPFGPNGSGTYAALDNRPYPVAADSGGCGFTATGNTGVADFNAVQFTTNNGGTNINMQLQPSSPGHLAASDGTDLGVNWNQLQTAIAGVN